MIVRARCPVRIDFAGPWTDCPEFFEEEGRGATLNAAITLDGFGLSCVEGYLRKEIPETVITYRADSVGSGLGTSAAMATVWLALIWGIDQDLSTTRAKKLIAEGAFQIERVLGTIGGKQDQYAAVFGGFNLFTFEPSQVSVESLLIDDELLDQLHSSLILFDTQINRLSSDIHVGVWERFHRGENRKALKELVEIAYQMRNAFLQRDLREIGMLLSSTWNLQKQLDESVTFDKLDQIFTILETEGVLWGGKALGAGGGGHLLFMVDPSKRDLAEDVLVDHGRLAPFQFDFKGLEVRRENM